MARLALDIDSTLHHYWDLLERAAMDRYGVAIPYAEQVDWNIIALDKDQLAACIAETHSDENILASEPYPGAVEAVNRWHDAGHFIHVTSHRRPECAPATHRWLTENGFRYHDLHCSFDKVPRCVELEIDVLIDDSPTNLAKARAHGIAGATLIHPWTEALVKAGEAGGAGDWPALETVVDAAIERVGTRTGSA